MNTLSIITIVLAAIYTIIVGWMAKNYKAEIKREYHKKDLQRGARAVAADIQILILKEKIKTQQQKIKQLINKPDAN
jgi:siroheme synthase (precorrin-2 oxidase/ferrochelatase)